MAYNILYICVHVIDIECIEDNYYSIRILIHISMGYKSNTHKIIFKFKSFLYQNCYHYLRLFIKIFVNNVVSSVLDNVYYKDYILRIEDYRLRITIISVA